LVLPSPVVPIRLSFPPPPMPAIRGDDLHRSDVPSSLHCAHFLLVVRSIHPLSFRLFPICDCPLTKKNLNFFPSSSANRIGHWQGPPANFDGPLSRTGDRYTFLLHVPLLQGPVLIALFLTFHIGIPSKFLPTPLPRSSSGFFATSFLPRPLLGAKNTAIGLPPPLPPAPPPPLVSGTKAFNPALPLIRRSPPLCG